MNDNQPPHTDGVKTIDQILHKLKTDAADARASCTERRNWEGYNGKYDEFENQAKAQLEAIMQERLDQQHNELTGNESKVWLTTEQLEKRLQDYAMKYAKKVQGQKISNWTDVDGKAAFKNIPLTNHNASMWRRGYNAAVIEQRTTNLTLKGKIDE